MPDGGSRLGRLPGELTREIGRFLGLSDLSSVRAAVPARVQDDLHPVFRAAYVSEVAGPVARSGAEFRRGALQTRRLPADLRARPLEALAARVMALPLHEQQAAIDQWLGVPITEPASALLNGLRQAARRGPVGLREREAALVLAGPAAAAVVAGARVRDVARAFGVAGAHSLDQLDRIALTQAEDALLAGEATVPELVERVGLAADHPHESLEQRALELTALPAVQRGESPDEVAERLGLDHPFTLHLLRIERWLTQVARGRPPREVIDEFQVPPDLRQPLYVHAVGTAGRHAIRAGSHWEDVAHRLGVEQGTFLFIQLAIIGAVEAAPVDEMRRREADLAFGGPAAAAVHAGGRVREVVNSFAIRGDTALRHLESMASARAADWLCRGEASVPEAIRRLGLVTDDAIEALEELALVAMGRRLIAAGQSVQQVAARLGIARALPSLQVLVAVHQVRRGRPPAELIDHFGLVGAHRQRLLERSVDTAGRNAVLGGLRVGDIAAWLGIQGEPPLLERLERLAADLVGVHLVLEAGWTPEQAARRLDIRDPQRVRDAVQHIQGPPDHPAPGWPG